MSRKITLLAGLSSLALVQPALAQDAAAEAVDQGGLEEIVVTAQKRSENVQTVPVAVSVVTADSLAATGGTQFTDLAKIAPGLTITRGDQPGNNQIYLRGVGTFAFSIGVEPSVLTVIDDVAVGLQAQSFGDLADLERVEVLRGPQSTLFGKAASAGVISVTTKAPSFDFGVNGEVTVTEDNEQRYQLGVTGPIGEKLAIRVSATIGRYKGNVRNRFTGNRLNGSDSEAFRAKLLWEPSDSFDATLSGYYIKAEQNCCASVFTSYPAATLFARVNPLGLAGVSAITYLGGVVPGYGTNREANLDVEPQADTKNYGGSLKFNVGLGEHTLTSITALSRFKLTDFTDFDASSFNALAYASGNAALSGSLTQNGSFDAKTFSQEVRLTSPSGPFEYIVGAYFAANDFTRKFRRDASRLQVRNWQGDTSSDSKALFAQGSLEVLEGTKILAGIRYNHETIRYRYYNFANGAIFPRDANLPGSSSDSVVIGKVGLQHEFSSNMMAFATYSRGYKGSAYDLTSSFNTTVARTQPISPETVDSFEIGFKSKPIDGLTLNVTGFFADYSNYQQQTIVPDITPSFVLSNVGKVRSKGIEAEMNWRTSDWLRLSGSLSYTDAKVREFDFGQCYPFQTTTSVATLAAIPTSGCYTYTGATGVNPANGRTVLSGTTAQNLAGARLNNAPKWKANIAADVTVPLGNLELGLNAAYQYQSGVFYSISQDPLSRHASYGVANLAVSIGDGVDDRWKLTAFVRNLFDKQYYASLANGGGLYTGPTQTGILPRDFDRYFGVRAAFSF